MLIGGAGADRLVRNADDDILIAGVTLYDENMAAYEAIMREWTRTDADYVDRIVHLRDEGETGLNAGFKLNDTSVFNDGDADVLTGSSGLDWFILDADDDDRATDLKDEVFAGDLDWILDELV